MNISEITTQNVNQWLSEPIGLINDTQVSIRVMQDMEAPFHLHPTTDEMFIVLEGILYIDTDSDTITLNKGQSYTIHSGTRHRTRAQSRVELLTIIKSDKDELV